MTTITAKIIADSINEQGKRLTTMQLRYPRWIHAEGRTHRLLRICEDNEFEWEPRTPSPMEDPRLSRNASSSRAVPVSKLIQDILDDPAIPMFWGANQKGMQAGEECTEQVIIGLPGANGFVNHIKMEREEAWLHARDLAIETAKAFNEAGYHKQIVNRLLEPFSHINVVVSATEWDNFYALRRHKDAEPHLHYLADRMWDAMKESKPQKLRGGQWHLPYVSVEEKERLGLVNAIALSVARCASVSYKTVDGLDMTVDRALALYTKLVGSHPLHASPAEHQAECDTQTYAGTWDNSKFHGNFIGWIQNRKLIPGEHIMSYSE